MKKLSSYFLAATVTAITATITACFYYYYKPTKKVKGVISLIGNTPLINIQCLSSLTSCQILAKVEFLNIGGSPKDRVALKMVEDAESKGLITPFVGCTLFEGTVGSTGISLALVAKAKGYNCHIVMPGEVFYYKC